MNDYEARRLEKIKHNQALLAELDIKPVIPSTRSTAQRNSKPPPSKKRKIAQQQTAPSRVSARLAASTTKPNYNDDDAGAGADTKSSTSKSRPSLKPSPPSPPASPDLDISHLSTTWSTWSPSAPSPPSRDPQTSQFHFPTHPSFTPNKSPEEMLREGVFGGSYFRPLHSRKLRALLPSEPDIAQLPPSWLEGLNISSQLTRETPEAEVNKFRVNCGQPIEEWEANGWIRHEFDPRGWFQWYIRFWLGRRCEDDDRQVGRWERCVGPRGRWRRMLLKAYVKAGVREVWDDGEEEDGKEVSPVMHQTCLHWGWEVRQEELNGVWEGGGG